jgi:hypothetical protein
MKYNFCKNCGSPVQPGMTNCQRCGAPVDQVQPVDENKPMAQPPGMLRQFYGDGNNMPDNNMAQPVQPTPMPQQPMDNMQQPPMGQPVEQPMPMNNNVQGPVQPMNQPMPQQPVQPMGVPMGQPMPQQVPAKQKNAMGSAVGSIVCGVIALFIFWWLSLCGLGLGVSAIKLGKQQNNNGAFIVAIIGILVCVADVVLYFLIQSGTIEPFITI